MDTMELVNEWYAVQSQIAPLVEREKELRQKLFAAAFPEPEIGTNRVPLGFGKELKAVYKLNYRIDKEQLAARKDDIDAVLFHEIVKFRPEINDSSWRKASSEERKLFADFVIETPGMPALEIVDKKKR